MIDEERPSYFGIIPANVRYDKSLTPNAKLLYSELTCLSNKNGYCHASNNYFAELYDVTPQAVSKWINQLADNGYVRLEYVYNGTEIKERRIYIDPQKEEQTSSTKDEKGINKRLKGYQQKIKENNTSNNNTSDNIINDTEKKEQKKTKHKYGTYKNVLLTDEERTNLDSELKEYRVEASSYIDYFSEQKEMKGYKYKSDYLAIKNWVKGDSKPKKNVYTPRSDAQIGKGMDEIKPDEPTFDF